MSKVLIVAIIVVFAWFWFNLVKDYPQCILAKDPIMCTQLLKGIGK